MGESGKRSQRTRRRDERRSELWALIALFFIACCADAPLPRSAPIAEEVLIAEAIPMWEQSTGTLATTPGCLLGLSRFQVVVADGPEHYRALTTLSPTETAGGLVGGTTAVLRDEAHVWATAAHELGHLLSACTYGDYDIEHERPEVWGVFVPWLRLAE
jgi:hypothetical protein